MNALFLPGTIAVFPPKNSHFLTLFQALYFLIDDACYLEEVERKGWLEYCSKDLGALSARMGSHCEVSKVNPASWPLEVSAL